MNQCHICLSTDATELIKCKLCCDGLEQDACIECTKLYGAYRQSGDRQDFLKLKARRAEGIAKARGEGK